MILFDYECTVCDRKFESLVASENRDRVNCKHCGNPARRLVSRTRDDWFRPFVSEDFNGEPIEVRTKEHYKRLCKEHNVYAPHCFGQGFNISEI